MSRRKHKQQKIKHMETLVKNTLVTHTWMEEGDMCPFGHSEFPPHDIRSFPGYSFPEPITHGLVYDGYGFQVEYASVPYGRLQVIMSYDLAQSRHLVYVWDTEAGRNSWQMAWSSCSYTRGIEQAKGILALIVDSFCRRACTNDEQMEEHRRSSRFIEESFKREQVNSWLSFIGREMLLM